MIDNNIDDKASLTISLNGYDDIDNHITIQFLKAAEVYMITPDVGSSSGGTVITIIGEYFDATLQWQCVFGLTGSYIMATLVSNNILKCVVPPADITATTVTSVGIGVNNNKNFLDFNILFTYYLEPSVTSVFPLNILSNSINGVDISITGTNFIQLEANIQKCIWREGVEDGNEVTSLLSIKSTMAAECTFPSTIGLRDGVYNMYMVWN